jgi:hypothetical protein
MARGDRADLRTRLKAEGFDYLTDARANELIDEAAEDVTLERQWPERLVSQSSVPPFFDVAGFDRVMLLTHDATGNVLEECERILLRRRGVVLTQVGQPLYWYFTILGSVATWPVSADSCTLEWISSRRWMSGGMVAANDADTPVVYDEVRQAIVLVAKAKAHEENGANALAAPARAAADAIIERAFATRSRKITQRSVRVVD